MKEKRQTFQLFPQDRVCPVCGTNEDAECVLVEIDGTEDGGLVDAVPTHKECAIATNFNRTIGVMYLETTGRVS